MSIQEAFQRAVEGAKCYNCQRRFNHAVYQRHIEACLVKLNGSSDSQSPPVNTETTFLTLETPIRSVKKALRSDKKPSRKFILKRLITNNSNAPSSGSLIKSESRLSYELPTKRIKRVLNFSEVNKAKCSWSANGSPVVTPSSSSSLRITKQEDENEKNLSIQEVFDSIVFKIHKLMSEQGWDSKNVCTAQQSSQRKPFCDVKNELSSSGFNQLSSPAKDSVVKCEPLTTLHYTLEFFWGIVLQVIGFSSCDGYYWFLRASKRQVLQAKQSSIVDGEGNCRIQDNESSSVISFFGSNLMPLHSLIGCSVVSQGISLDEGLKMLLLSDITKLCKEFRVNTGSSNRQGLIAKLREVASNQSAIFSSSVRSAMIRSIKKLVGDACFRIPESLWKLCLSLFTLYSPSTMDSSELIDEYVNLPQRLLFKMLQVKRGEVKYPVPARVMFSTMMNYYASYDDLLSYVEAKLTEENVLHLKKRRDNANLMLVGKEAKKTLVIEHLQNETRMRWYEFLPKCIRKFSGAWVLIRCVFHHVEAAQALKDYECAVKLLKFLINHQGVRIFCHSVRGVWYNRLALNLDFHLKRKEEALECCLTGLSDEDVGTPMALALQNRLKKLAAKTNYECKIELIDPKKITIEGVVLGKNLGDQRTNRFYIQYKEDVGNCDVEIVALDYFMKNGFTEGLHAEGSSWHTLFGLLFADIIFAEDIPHVWVSELQANPLDLNSNALYTNRKKMFDDRFEDILNNGRESMCSRVEENYRKLRGCTNSEISWECFANLDQIQRFLSCCTAELLVNIFRRMALDYRNTRSGFPDLTLWNAETKRLAMVEVKGPNDSLSTKQCLWLDFFARQGIEAFVCYVSAKKRRLLE